MNNTNNTIPTWTHRYGTKNTRGGSLELLLPDISILKYYFNINKNKGVIKWRVGSHKGLPAGYAEKARWKVGLYDSTGKRAVYSVDKIIFYASTGLRPDGGNIIHLNNENFDDRATNLRFVESNATDFMYINKTEGGKHKVKISTCLNYERFTRHLGTFDSIEEAEQIRNEFLLLEDLFHLVQHEYPHLRDSNPYDADNDYETIDSINISVAKDSLPPPITPTQDTYIYTRSREKNYIILKERSMYQAFVVIGETFISIDEPYKDFQDCLSVLKNIVI